MLKHKKLLIFFSILLFFILSFQHRLNNFKNTKERTIDEISYYHLGLKLKNNISDYHTQEFAKNIEQKDGIKLPPYYHSPLFKHPPLFSMMTAASLSLFGVDPISGVYCPLLLSLLTVLMVYILGTLCFSRTIGIISALLFYIDPTHIFCSQKIWMDSSLSFFMLLSLTLFLFAKKSKKNYLFIFSGLAAGLAVSIKYPGVLVTFALIIFAFLYDNSLFKNKHFRWSILIPFLFLIPWIYWNYQIFGENALSEHILSHDYRLKKIYQFLSYGTIVISVLMVGLWGLKKLSLKRSRGLKKYFLPQTVKTIKIISALCFFFFLLPDIINSLSFVHLPKMSTFPGLFKQETILFYFSRLIQYSFLFTFSFLGFFIKPLKENNFRSCLKTYILTILIFFSVWRSYQSRYILTIIPALILLGVDTWKDLYARIEKHPNPLLKKTYLSISVILGIFIIARTLRIDLILSFPNNMCYF